jgi:hypothetical protein
MFDRLRWLGAVLIGILLVGSSDALGAWPECARVGETGCYRGMFYMPTIERINSWIYWHWTNLSPGKLCRK